MKKSWCLDLHGVINSSPEFFAAVTQSLKKEGWEIHVATGSHLKEKKVVEELDKYGIAYTHLFSIADHHKENNTQGMWHDKNGNPWVSNEDWDRTKANYCKQHDISMCTDDTARYARHFETPFSYMTIQSHKREPNRYLEYVIDMFEKRSKKTFAKKIKELVKSKIFSFSSNYKKVEAWANMSLGFYLSPRHKLGKER